MKFPHCSINHRQDRRLLGFSMTELLVVIAIIVILAGLLLMAMGTVRAAAMQSSTTSTMSGFAQACEAFHIEHGRYPGVIPENVLAQTPRISGTENALIELMGGFRVLPPNPSQVEQQDYDTFRDASPNPIEHEFPVQGGNWRLVIDVQRIGEGPIINRKPYSPYFTPGPREVQITEGQMAYTGGSWDFEVDNALPDLIDGWGQPILYIRQVRTRGPLVGPYNAAAADRPQFLLGAVNQENLLAGMGPYLQSTSLGAMHKNQGASILRQGTDVNVYSTVAQILRHPSFGDEEEDPLDPEQRDRVRARGAYVLISAGKDGIFFSAEDGPGTPGNPVTQIDDPSVVADYDDIIHFGGG